MPIYEFECQACKHRCEALVRSTDDKVPCPKCGSGNLVKLLSAFHTAGGEKHSQASDEGEGCASCPSGQTCPYGGEDFE